MKIRARPQKPDRDSFKGRSGLETIYKESVYGIAYFDVFIDNMLQLKSRLATQSKNRLFIEFEIDDRTVVYSGDIPSVKLEIKKTIFPEEEYQEALIEYETKLKKWEDWYTKNKEAIDKELAKREEYKREIEKLNEKFKI